MRPERPILRLVSSRHHRYPEQLGFLRGFTAYAVQTSGERSALWYWNGAEPACLEMREVPDGIEVAGDEEVARRIFRTHAPDLLPEEALPAAPPAHRLLYRRYAGIRPVLFANAFEGIAWTILGQQISVAMAARLKHNMAARYGVPIPGGSAWLFPRPDHLLRATVEELRALQLSGAKAATLLSLARDLSEGAWDGARLLEWPTTDAVTFLERFRGVGRWSAEYILLRVFGHTDVLPGGDAALQRAWSRLTGAEAREPELRHAAEAWKGWRSDFAFYLWLDNRAHGTPAGRT